MTFGPTKNTPFYRLPYEATFVPPMGALIRYGSPLQAIVQVFNIEERTLTRWWDRAGDHAPQSHESEVQTSGVDTRHVQAEQLQEGSVSQEMMLSIAETYQRLARWEEQNLPRDLHA